jgi:cytochrome c oxidase subunit II
LEVRSSKWGRAGWIRRAPWFVAAALGTACSTKSPSILHPRGSAAREVTGLWWPMLWVSVAVTVFVTVMGAWAVVKRRNRPEPEIAREVPWGDRFILISGLGVTTIILVTFFVFSLRSMSRLSSSHRAGLEITVIGHDWWWEARYPNGAVTANEIHIPVRQRVHINLRSADVIHSLWVPELAPKIDLIPGRDNEMSIEADRPGDYRGQCAEYCGLQHAHMIFFVVAEAQPSFDRWMTQMAAPALQPTSAIADEGRSVFLSNTCIGCHTIRGTPASGGLGPDLTHLATRRTIAAGTLPLTPATLREWILDPQSIKPGTTMPPTALSPTQIQALLSYLLSLGFGSS